MSPWRDRFAWFGSSFDPTPTPGVARVAVIPIPTATPAPVPTEALTPAPPPPEQSVERALAVIPEPEPAPPPPPPPPPAGGFRHDIAGGIAVAFNDVRAQNGLGAVSANGSLNAAAQAYAEFHYLNYGPLNLSHSYDGTPGDRAARSGYSWSNIGEVIAGGGNSAQDFVTMWLNSGGHRDIILDAVYVDVGVGCYESPGQAILCVALFGAPL